MWNWSVDSTFGGAPLIIQSGDKVLVDASVSLFAQGGGLSNTVRATFCPCYSTSSNFMNPVIPPISGLSNLHSQLSSGESLSGSASYEWTNLPAGTYYFSWCAKITPGYSQPFTSFSPKITALVY